MEIILTIGIVFTYLVLVWIESQLESLRKRLCLAMTLIHELEQKVRRNA